MDASDETSALELAPVPSVPQRHPSGRQAAEVTLTFPEILMLHQASHAVLCALFLVPFMLGGAFLEGLAMSFVLVLVTMTVRNLQVRNAFLGGFYGKAMAMAEFLDRHEGKSTPHWKAIQGECLLMLGRSEEAKQILDSLDPAKLGGQLKAARMIDLAVLCLRIPDPDGCLRLLDEMEKATGDRFAANRELARAAAYFFKDEFVRSLEHLDRLNSSSVDRLLEVGILNLRASIALEHQQDPRKALAFSHECLRLMENIGHARPAVLTDHAFFVVEASGDVQTALDLLTEVFGHEPELGPTGQACFHYVQARCFLESDLIEDAARQLEEAEGLPASPSLTRRIQALRQRLEEVRARR